MQAVFSFSDVLSQFLAFLSIRQFGINSLDLIMLGVIIFYSYEGYLLGFVLALLDFGSFILAFIIGLVFFSSVGQLLVQLFSLPQGFANAIGFFLVALISEVVLSLFSRILFRKVSGIAQNYHVPKFLAKLNRPLGIFPGLASAYILLSFILTVIIALPTSPSLKQLVSDSRLGSSLVAHTASLQTTLNDVFGGAVQDSLNVMTVKPEGDEPVSLHFTVPEPVPDEEAEAQMVALINKEREETGLQPLRPTAKLVILARAYATDMLQRGYFSHYNPENVSPFDRMTNADIEYLHAGENLALAPSTSLAHQGLMNSPGHRANILSPDYHQVGVGVMDAGIYGKMFVQEFTD